MSSYYGKLKDRYRAIQGINIDMAAEAARLNEVSAEKAAGPSTDTVLRKKLQLEVIKPLAEAGRSVSEIVKILYTMNEYEKFQDYFVGYAENQVNKFGKVNNKKGFDQR